MRGRIIVWSPPQIEPKDYDGPHYWVVVSRDSIGLYAEGPKKRWPPLLVVPFNTYRGEEETPQGASDILIGDGTDFENPIEKGVRSLVRCGEIRPCHRRKILPFDGLPVSVSLLEEIDERLVSELGLENYIDRLVEKNKR